MIWVDNEFKCLWTVFYLCVRCLKRVLSSVTCNEESFQACDSTVHCLKFWVFPFCHEANQSALSVNRTAHPDWMVLHYLLQLLLMLCKFGKDWGHSYIKSVVNSVYPLIWVYVAGWQLLCLFSEFIHCHFDHTYINFVQIIFTWAIQQFLAIY